jgi:hypothetical protein
LLLSALTNYSQTSDTIITDHVFVKEYQQRMMRVNYPWMVQTLKVLESGKEAKEKLKVTTADLDSCMIIANNLTRGYDTLSVAYEAAKEQVDIKREMIELHLKELEVEKEIVKQEKAKSKKKSIAFWAITGAAILELITIMAVAIN